MWGTERTEPMASFAHSSSRPPRSAGLLICVVLAALGSVVPAPTEASTPLPRVTLTATVRQLGTLGGAQSTAVDMAGGSVTLKRKGPPWAGRSAAACRNASRVAEVNASR